MRLKLKAYIVCSIPTYRWAFGLRQMVRFRYQVDRGAWNETTSKAWDAAESDRPYRRPKAFGWPGEGAPIPPAEGNGGAPLAWLLRCKTSTWEVIAASRYHAWVKMEGDLRLVDYEEGGWLSDALSRRAEKTRVITQKRRAKTTLPEAWPLLYREGVNRRVELGEEPAEAHFREAWAWGAGWQRQPGDRGYYGNVGCGWCHRDGMCTMFDYARGKGVTGVSSTAFWEVPRSPRTTPGMATTGDGMGRATRGSRASCPVVAV